MTNDSSPWMELRFPDLDEPLHFYAQSEVAQWVQSEKHAWSWLWSEPTQKGTLKGEHFRQVKNLFDNALAALQDPLEQNSNQYRHAHTLVLQTCNRSQQHSAVPSGSETAVRIFGIKDGMGQDIGRWAFQYHVRGTTFGQVSHAEDYPLYLASILHTEEIFTNMHETLKSERARYRSEITKLGNRVRELESERAEERRRERVKHRKGVRRLLRQTRAVWESGLGTVAEQTSKAVASITATEEHYRNQMALMAPVQYWKEKAKNHALWELLYAGLCLLFFGLAALAIVKAASGAIQFLQRLEGAAGQGAQTSAYIITAGALLGGTTLLFWLGRVLVKLFLSEHHLRSECSEKAIMTQAFLSMETNETNFGETDRAIVLASIFRTSPDGIVKDEGPTDIAGTAILAKLLAR